jgi:Tol biopolymer transport system component
VETGEVRVVIEDGGFSAWSATGHLLFTRADTLLAAPFDLGGLEVTGSPVAITDGILSSAYSPTWFTISTNGTLVYLPGGQGHTRRRIVFVDRNGNVEPWSDERHAFGSSLVVSGDGRRLAVTIENVGEKSSGIWVSDVDHPRLRPLADERGMDCAYATWSPDGHRLVYACWGEKAMGIYMRPSDGSEEPELLVEADPRVAFIVPYDFSPDATTLLFYRGSPMGGEASEILSLPMQPDSEGTRTPSVFFADQSNPLWAQFSPDGRWIAYSSDETGRYEAYLRSFGEDGSLGPSIQISNAGAESVIRWSKNGRGSELELLYWDPAQRLMAVSVASEPTLTVSEPQLVLDGFELGIPTTGGVPVDTMPDGRFIAVQKSEEEEAAQIHVVQNFHDELKRRVPTR